MAISFFFFYLFLIALGGPETGTGKYFLNPDNYDTVECRIIYRDNHYRGIMLLLEPIDEESSSYGREYFYIDGHNEYIAENNGINEILDKAETDKDGVVITIKTTPKKFNDGYLLERAYYPIAGLSYDGQEILPFDPGYVVVSNLQYEATNRASRPVLVTGGILLFGIVIFVTNFIVFKKSKPRE